MNPTPPIDSIERLCQDYAKLRGKLEKKIEVIEREREKILEAHRVELRLLSSAVSNAKLDLERQVGAARPLFIKPKTRVFHGIKVGFEKERDQVTYPEDEILIPRIESLLKSKAAGLIETTKRIIKDAFKRLPKAELQSLGVKYTNGADSVIVRPESKSDVEKLASAYLDKNQAENSQQQEAA